MAKKGSTKGAEKAQTKAQKQANKEITVIGVGASAGGLKALESLFSSVPYDSVAYVIVQHLSSEHRSMLTELLSQHSVLEVVEASNHMVVEKNKVYVIPHNKELTIKDNFLYLSDKVTKGRSDTVDTFFKSLAVDKGHRAIGIILSGTGSDGTEGIVAIKKAGGIVMVQSPVSARFDGMPLNAINTGYADLVTEPELMPQEIFKLIDASPATREEHELLNSETEAFYYHILEMIRDRAGIDFSNYKRPTIIRRISRRMAITNTVGLIDYLDYLHLHSEEVEILSKELLIGVTKFFRDRDAYDVLGKKIIPALVDGKEKGDQLRVWVAGCSTGEEAYSLAILIREYLDKVRKELEVKIFASDIDRDALEYAGKGLYPANSLTDMSKERLHDFFVMEDGKYRVNQRVRRMVIFAPHNVTNDPPFSKVDLVSCRNMLIYLNPALQKKVIDKFHYSLVMGGYLFLGSSESIGEMRSFAEINKKWKIYRNMEPARSLGMDSHLSSNYTSTISQSPANSFARDLPARQMMQQSFSELLNDTILDEYEYAAVFTDEHYNVLHGVGRFKNYLDLPEQNFTLNLLKLVPQELSAKLGSLLRQAVRDKAKISARGIQVREGEKLRSINVVVNPYLSDKNNYQKFILVLFGEDRPSVPLEEGTHPMVDEGHYEGRVKELETELQHTKDDLQAVVEELETSNEELQSTNEELLSSNEELQSTNEELQSLNEELHTINVEHQFKIKALMELDDDLNNYFRSTDIGQIFVDRKLVIRKYTPAATRLINLIESDIGRSIYQISNNLRYDNLIEDVRQVIASNRTFEKEVQDKRGTWYQMRILPYITQDNRIDGAIILFIEINELKILQLLHVGILHSSPNAIIALKAVRNTPNNRITDFELNILNGKAEELFNASESSLIGKSLWKAAPHLLDHRSLFEQFVHVVETGEPLDVEQPITNGQADRYLHVVAVKFDDGLVLTLHEITERKLYERTLKQQQEEIRSSAERFRTLLEAVPHITWTNRPSGENTSYNEHWYAYTGLSREESEGWGWGKAFHPEDLSKLMPSFKQAMRRGDIFQAQARLLRKSDNQYRWHLLKTVPIRNEAGKVTQWVGTATDIQDQKEAEEANIKLRLAQQREILNTILHTQEEERKKISEALHNGLGQLLYAAKLNLSGVTSTDPEQKQKIEKVTEFLGEGIEITRNISHEMAPTILRDFGLQVAVEEMITRLNSSNLKITFSVTGFDKRLEFLKENSLYRIIQELLNNIIRHSKATKAAIKLTCKDGRITLLVKDNGIGFNKEELQHVNGIGLMNIRNRVDLLEGKMEISTSEGKGTQVKISLLD